MTRQRALSVGFRTNRPAKAKVSFRNIQHPANIQTQSMANETRSHTKGIGYSAKDESGDIATDVFKSAQFWIAHPLAAGLSSGKSTGISTWFMFGVEPIVAHVQVDTRREITPRLGTHHSSHGP